MKNITAHIKQRKHISLSGILFRSINFNWNLLLVRIPYYRNIIRELMPYLKLYYCVYNIETLSVLLCPEKTGWLKISTAKCTSTHVHIYTRTQGLSRPICCTGFLSRPTSKQKETQVYMNPIYNLVGWQPSMLSA